MSHLRLSLFEKVELSLLRFNHKKIDRWLQSKNIIDTEEYAIFKEKLAKLRIETKEIVKLLDSFGKRVKVRYKNRKEKQRHLKEVRKISKTLHKILVKTKRLKKELNKGCLFFDSFWRFALFTVWFEITFFGKLGIRNIKHEREHARVFLKNKIKVRYGWQKLFEKERKQYRFDPFVVANAPEKVHLRALKAVKNPSKNDKLDFRIAKKI